MIQDREKFASMVRAFVLRQTATTSLPTSPVAILDRFFKGSS